MHGVGCGGEGERVADEPACQIRQRDRVGDGVVGIAVGRATDMAAHAEAAVVEHGVRTAGEADLVALLRHHGD